MVLGGVRRKERWHFKVFSNLFVGLENTFSKNEVRSFLNNIFLVSHVLGGVTQKEGGILKLIKIPE